MANKDNVKGYRFAGDIEIKGIVLIDTNGTSIDMSSVVLEVNIFQDLFQHYLQCEVAVSDALSLFTEGSTGGEVLIISYRTRTDKNSEFKTHFFGVNTISDRQRIDEKIEAYILNGISAEAYNASVTKISRTYGSGGGNTISNMIRSIVNEFVYNDAIKNIHNSYKSVLNVLPTKNIVFDSTNGTQKIIVPNLSVDDTIDFLCAEADCDNHTPYYIFFESTNGFNFKDLNSLITSEPKEKYSWVPANVKPEKQNSDTEVKDFQKIISFNLVRQSDILLNAREGLFRTKVINLDILQKNKNEVVFNYDNEYSRFSTLQTGQIPGSSEEPAIIYMMQSRTGHDSGLYADENVLPKRVNQFISRKKSFQRHIFNIVMEVTIPGDSEITVGDVIELDIPNATTLDKLDGKRDKYLSGKYLITRARHKFGGKSGSEFNTIIQCVKDTGTQ